MAPFQDEQPEGEETDRRKERRWNIPIPVRVRGSRSDGARFDEETITADASPSGMCVLLTLELQKGNQIELVAPEEGFESSATVAHVSALGPNMNRVRVLFPIQTKFGRAAAPKKYVYDYAAEHWVGYIFEGIYYNSKHEPFGKIEGNTILSLASGTLLFRLKADRVYDLRANCIGHLV